MSVQRCRFCGAIPKYGNEDAGFLGFACDTWHYSFPRPDEWMQSDGCKQRCREGRLPTTDNLEAYGKAVAATQEPILPEYGTLNPPPIDPYNVRIGGVLADPYRVARAYGIDDPVIFQALKKLLRCGRKHKAKAADVRESITSLERWEAMNREDQKHSTTAP